LTRQLHISDKEKRGELKNNVQDTRIERDAENMKVQIRAKGIKFLENVGRKKQLRAERGGVKQGLRAWSGRVM